MGSKIRKAYSVVSFLVKFYGIGVPNAVVKTLVERIAKSKGQKLFAEHLSIELARYADIGALEAFVRPMTAKYIAWCSGGGAGGEDLRVKYTVSKAPAEILGAAGHEIAGTTRECRSVYFARAGERLYGEPLVLYIHGGCFGVGLTPLDYMFMARFHEGLTDVYPETTLLMLDYACASSDAESSYAVALLDVVHTYQAVRDMHPNTDIWVVANEAGAHLGLGLLQFLAEMNQPAEKWPQRCFMLSPLVNLSSYGVAAESAQEDKDHRTLAAFYRNTLASMLRGFEDGGKASHYVNLEANFRADLWKIVLEHTELRFATAHDDLLREHIASLADKLNLKLITFDKTMFLKSVSCQYKIGDEWQLSDDLAHEITAFFYFH